jgi:hypothetical protein
MNTISALKDALCAGEGMVRLAPNWIPRSFLMPGGRLKLDPRDLWALGPHRGGIDERWLASTTIADNGPGTPMEEGLSFIDVNGTRYSLKEAIELMGGEFLGAEVMAEQGGWNVLCKLFDNLGPIPFHMHQMDEHAAAVKRKGKPEAYYFPPQYNFSGNHFPHSYMGLDPGTSRDDIRYCLEHWNDGDNGILYHSKAYKLQPGTGWQIDAGVLHAPGSLVTYEPQVNSDVFAMFQSLVEDRPVPWELLVKDVPPYLSEDLDYMVDMLDWEKNLDPEFARHNKVFPRAVCGEMEMAEAGYREVWVTYGRTQYSARELTVYPGRSVTIKDAAAYGVILTQGRGTMGPLQVETPALIRFGEMTRDELFVTAAAAAAGVTVTNASEQENMVMLRHFGPGNPDAAPLVS